VARALFRLKLRLVFYRVTKIASHIIQVDRSSKNIYSSLRNESYFGLPTILRTLDGCCHPNHHPNDCILHWNGGGNVDWHKQVQTMGAGQSDGDQVESADHSTADSPDARAQLQSHPKFVDQQFNGDNLEVHPARIM
jgi:hypothetical protein